MMPAELEDNKISSIVIFVVCSTPLTYLDYEPCFMTQHCSLRPLIKFGCGWDELEGM